MNNSYLDKLTKFAEFYFEYTFKGNVTVMAVGLWDAA